jgi:hypothetical protein
VPGFRFLGPQSANVQLFRRFQSLQRKALRGKAVDWNQSGSSLQSALQLFPGFLIKFFGGLQRSYLKLLLLHGERGEKPLP